MRLEHFGAGLREAATRHPDRAPFVGEQRDDRREFRRMEIGKGRFETADKGVADGFKNLVAIRIGRALGVEAKRGVDAVREIVAQGLLKLGVSGIAELRGKADDSRTTDLSTFGKGLGSGVPISAIVAPCHVMDFQEAFALITTTGNAVSTCVAHAVLDTIENEDLIANAQARGEQIKAGLRDLQERHALIGDVRGRGLAIGFELIRDRETKEPATSEAAKVVLRGYQLGVVFTYVGMFSNVPELTPPLTLSEAEADEAVQLIGQAISDVEQGKVSDEEVAAFAGW
tara:strand:+ start:12936 stop:13793 length:858 start_codon:yes stop_codon:yes gene_type:complete